MALTPAQQATLKAAILADPELSAFPNTSDGNFDMANSTTTGLRALVAGYIVWRSAVTIDEITRADNFDWTRVDNLSVGKDRIWTWMFDGTNTINPSKANVRVGIDSVWVGTQADLNVRAVVYAQCKRVANKLEKIFATGTGSDASPAVMAVEGTISGQDVSTARNS